MIARVPGHAILLAMDISERADDVLDDWAAEDVTGWRRLFLARLRAAGMVFDRAPSADAGATTCAALPAPDEWRDPVRYLTILTLAACTTAPGGYESESESEGEGVYPRGGATGRVGPEDGAEGVPACGDEPEAGVPIGFGSDERTRGVTEIRISFPDSTTCGACVYRVDRGAGIGDCDGYADVRVWRVAPDRRCVFCYLDGCQWWAWPCPLGTTCTDDPAVAATACPD